MRATTQNRSLVIYASGLEYIMFHDLKVLSEQASKLSKSQIIDRLFNIQEMINLYTS
jgi:hypothetical protein